MQIYYLELPFPPTVNSYYVKTQRGIYVSKKGRAFREDVADASSEQNVYGLKLDVPLTLDVILYPPDNRERDLDNYMKALQDSITQAGVWANDSLIDNLNVHRGVKCAGGACWVRITEHHGFILPHNSSVWDHLD